MAFILGGGVGLYVTLGVRNPSAAILVASLVLPIATFYAIVSFLLEMPLYVFLVTTSMYGLYDCRHVDPGHFMSSTSPWDERGERKD